MSTRPVSPDPWQSLRHLLTTKSAFGQMTIFHFESARSSELGRSVEEAPLVEAACRLSNHTFVPFRPTNIAGFAEHLRYVFATWKSPAESTAKPQFVLHLSCHGNDSGISIGGNKLGWAALGDLISTAAGQRNIPFVLMVSACGGPTPSNLTTAFGGSVHPVYIFSFAGKVDWTDAALTWAILYHKISAMTVGDVDAVQALVTAIHSLALGNLRYHRWTGNKYLHFNPATQKST